MVWRLTDDALEAAVKMSVRYINDRFLPDKAIDVIDEASFRKYELRKLSDPVPDIEKLENGDSERLRNRKRNCHKDCRSCHGKRNPEPSERAGGTELDSCKEKDARKNRRRKVVNENAVADTISEWTRIPVQKLTEGETKRLAHLEKELHKRVIGQEEAVKGSCPGCKERQGRSERPQPSDWFFPVSGTYRRG